MIGERLFRRRYLKEGFQQGIEEGMEKGREEGREEGVEKGGEEERRLWLDWDKRWKEAEAQGEEFNEPPPGGERGHCLSMSIVGE